MAKCPNCGIDHSQITSTCMPAIENDANYPIEFIVLKGEITDSKEANKLLRAQLAAATREIKVLREALMAMAVANGAARGYDSKAVLKSIDEEIERAEAVIKSREEQEVDDE